MTSNRAGSTPAKNAVNPSSRKRENTVRIVEGLRAGLEVEEWVGRVELLSAVRAVIRVLITQIGFVIRTVALPAIAPAIMDSTVVSFRDARRLRRAARENKSRVHSYPGFVTAGKWIDLYHEEKTQPSRRRTIVVDEVSYGDPKKSRVQARV